MMRYNAAYVAYLQTLTLLDMKLLENIDLEALGDAISVDNGEYNIEGRLPYRLYAYYTHTICVVYCTLETENSHLGIYIYMFKVLLLKIFENLPNIILVFIHYNLLKLI